MVYQYKSDRSGNKCYKHKGVAVNERFKGIAAGKYDNCKRVHSVYYANEKSCYDSSASQHSERGYDRDEKSRRHFGKIFCKQSGCDSGNDRGKDIAELP